MYVLFFYFRDYVCYFKKINEKLSENKTIYRWLYYIPIIKLKIMLNEPFMLSMVWKSKRDLEIWVWKSIEFLMENVGTLSFSYQTSRL